MLRFISIWFFFIFSHILYSQFDFFFSFPSSLVLRYYVDVTDATELLQTVRKKLFIENLFVHTRRQHDWLLYCRNNTANVTIYFSYFTCDIKSWFKKRRISVSIKWTQFQSNTHSFMWKMNSFSKQELCVWSNYPF